MLRKVAVSLVVIGLLAGIGAFGALSVFIDTADVDENTFTVATVDISTDHPATALITLDHMMPGDKVTEPLTVSNDGDLELRYAVTSVADNIDVKGLRSQLDLSIKSGVTTCDNAGFGTDGVTLYDADVLGGASAINVIGNPAQGENSGDRPLDASDDEVLCFQVELPVGTTSAHQGATTTATFSFVAEQTVNNP
jgi:hypothetical protein